MSVLLSIFITAHREGLIAHKTMRSLERALRRLDESCIDYEAIVHIDDGDEVTRAYFERQSLFATTVFENAFGDIGTSRNFCVEQASGRYVAFIDADDLVGGNWLVDALEHLEERPNVIAHAEYSVLFGESCVVWPKANSGPIDVERLIAVSDNRWDSAIVARRELLEDNPYSSNVGGFGMEDWHFNCETLSRGIEHHVVPETALFVRRKAESMMTRQAVNFHTVQYTRMLDFVEVARLNADARHHAESCAPGRVRRSIEWLTRRGGEPHEPDPRERRLPGWLYDQWLDMHDLDKELFPPRGRDESPPIYRCDQVRQAGLVYKGVADSLSAARIDHLVFAPSCFDGEGERIAVRDANRMARKHPRLRVAVFTTDDGRAARTCVPERTVDYVDFGAMCDGLSKDEQLRLLARIIVQARVNRIQVVNSALASAWVERHKQLIRTLGIEVYPSAIRSEWDETGREGGFVHDRLPAIMDVTTRVLAEDQDLADRLISEYGYERDRFVVDDGFAGQHQPGPIKVR
ncbi:MAG: hypothetical protein CMJ18_11950 [Phycisphaeraceae bacterium]|nr:hypothetical protein [Phycisphaeraceae bacterium]